MRKSLKPKLIIFEGPDKVGKSTIYQAYRRATNYGPLCIDRFLTSNEVYDDFYDRDHYADYPAIMAELEELFEVHQICLICDEDELLTRIEKEEEGVNMPRAKNNMRKTLRQFQTATSCPSNSYIVDTTYRSVEEVVNEILRLTGEADQRKITEQENDMTGSTNTATTSGTKVSDVVDRFNAGDRSTIVRKVRELYTGIHVYGDRVGNTQEPRSPRR